MYSSEHIQKLMQFAKDHRLSFPEGIENYSYDWLSCQYNGIGAGWMPKYVRSFLTKLLSPMESASLFHDFEYLNKDKSYWNFTKANFRLFYNGAKSGYFKAGLFCGLCCQLFGWSAWKNGKELDDWANYLEETGYE